MTDDVTFQTAALATPPDATVIATDDVGGKHHQRVKVDLGGDGVSSPLVRGQQADSASLPVTLSTEGTAQLGSLTETAPTNDTASSGLNGRLQRIAQRLTSILAKLPALGTAGTASADVITVQGVASMTPVQIGDNSASLTVDAPVGTPVFVRLSDGSSAIATLPVSLASVPSHAVTNAGTFAVQAAGDVASAASDSGNPVKVGAKYNSTQPTFTDGQRGDAQIDARGNQRVVIQNATSQAAVSNPNADNLSSQNGLFVVAQGIVYDGSTWDRMPGDSANGTDVDVTRIAAGTNLIGDVGLQPRTSGGLSVVQLNGSDGGGGVLVATAQVIKASAGQLYGYYIYNPNTAATFVHFYNTAAASVTVGTTNPLMSVTIPALSAANLTFPIGVTFSNAGWSAAATTTAGGNTAPSTGLDVTVFYA